MHENVKFLNSGEDASKSIFPALQEYQTNHNISTLKKLCIEISDFCRALYASTTNDEERQVLKEFLNIKTP